MYNLFLGCALTIASNLTFMDKLLLRMDIDLGLFGTIKGVMYLFPAIVYQFLVIVLKKLRRDVQICAASYFLRVLLPVLLPFMAMLTGNRQLLTLGSIILLPLGMLFAVIANNTLMTIYRKVIPQEKFNYSIGMINMFLAMPSYLLGLPFAWLLDKMEHLDNFEYFLIFGIAQLVTLAFELPAILFIRKIKVPYDTAGSTEKIDMLAPYRDPKLRVVMLINILHRIVNGLMVAYLTVYFLKVADFSMTALLTISISLGLLSTFSMPHAGKTMDRWGYSRFFIIIAGVMLTGTALFTACWKMLLILPLFALFCWDCNATPVGGWLNMGTYSASVKLANQENLNAAVAAYSICFNGGLSVGLLLASGLFGVAGRLNGSDLASQLHTYFLLTLPFFGLLLGTTLYFHKINRKSE
ncbi:MAG: hypothetical protein IKC89_07680 [Lentisphaeria bacterium]|nr:hypothetical protein [Lentisphaeria bacterium]